MAMLVITTGYSGEIPEPLINFSHINHDPLTWIFHILFLGQKAEIKHRFEEAGISPFFEVICNSPHFTW